MNTYKINYGMNYMISCDGKLFASIIIPAYAGKDYGYMAMKRAIINMARKEGIDARKLQFAYDGMESSLTIDAFVDCKVNAHYIS